jgi:hypothetical protein
MRKRRDVTQSSPESDPSKNEVVPTDVIRIIRVVAYEFLPRRSNGPDRQDVEQQALAAVWEMHLAGRSWDIVRRQARAIVRNKALDVFRQRKRFEQHRKDAAFAMQAINRALPDEAMRGLLIRALLRAAKQVTQSAADHRASRPSDHSDLLARQITRSWLKALFSGQPKRIADIGRSLGLEDRRRANETFHRVRILSQSLLRAEGYRPPE